MQNDSFDVVIVGGGPAGLSGALILGRCCRRVLVCDNQQYRNAYSKSMHGFLTRDGIDPVELRRIAHKQLEKYPSVNIQNVTVMHAAYVNGGFSIKMANGGIVSAKKLLIATGLCDEWPNIKGARELFGSSIFLCPYCDAWEVKNLPLAVYAYDEKKGTELALELTLWSKDIVLCTHSAYKLSHFNREHLARYGIVIREERIVHLESKDGILQRIIFEHGEALNRRALFFNTIAVQRSDLALQLGCEFDEKGGIKVGPQGSTSIPGLFVAGDASREVLQAIVAASEGAEAAIAINASLLKKDLEF